MSYKCVKSLMSTLIWTQACVVSQNDAVSKEVAQHNAHVASCAYYVSAATFRENCLPILFRPKKLSHARHSSSFLYTFLCVTFNSFLKLLFGSVRRSYLYCTIRRLFVQHLDVLGSPKALTEFGLSDSDLTRFRGHWNAAPLKTFSVKWCLAAQRSKCCVCCVLAGTALHAKCISAVFGVDGCAVQHWATCS